MTDLVHQSLFQHTSRPEWGGALIAWERDGKRGYQFEDGRLRIFTTGHYYLLEPIAASLDRVRTLRSLVGHPDDKGSEGGGTAPGVASVDEQVAYFLATYPGGFAGEQWRAEHRGGAEGRRKRHRDRAIALARTELTAAHIASCLEERREEDGIAKLSTVLLETGLVPAAHVQRVSGLPPNRSHAVLVGLQELLFGSASADVRMVQWIQALIRGTGKKPTWPLATAPLALVYPDEHVCVQRASFVAQAAAMGRRLRVAASPSGSDYVPLVSMAHRLRAYLTSVECAPADLLDLHDFIVWTLNADATKAIAAGRPPV